MIKVSKFDSSNPSTVRMAPGNFSFSAEIVDTWGAKAFFSISTRTEFILPSNDQRIAFEESGVKDEIMVRGQCVGPFTGFSMQGSGDSKALMLILAAESAISAIVGPIQKNESIIGKTCGLWITSFKDVHF